MLISLGLPTDRLPAAPELATGAAITSISTRAEAAGYDALFVTDHPFPSASWLQRRGHHSMDPFVVLSFAAAATDRIALQTNLLILAYRNPFLAAHGVATLDAMSGGRMIVGIGAGYLEAEFEALGATYAGRGAATDEAIVAMKAAWSGDPVAMTGSRFVATDNVMQPRPAQRPHPPILVGGNSVAAITRAARLADGWVPMPSPKAAAGLLKTPGIETLDDLRDRIALATRLGEEAGRSTPLQIWFTPWGLSGFGTTGWDATRLRDDIDALAVIGVAGVTITLPGTTLAEFEGNLDRFAQDVIAG